MSTYNVCDLVSSTVRKFFHSISAAKCTSPKSALKKIQKIISMKTLKLDFINAKSYIIGLQNVHVRISFYRNQKPFCVNPQVIIEKLFPNNGEKIVDSNCQTTETIWPVTSFKLFIVHVHGYILMTIGSGFLFWNQNFCLQIKK